MYAVCRGRGNAIRWTGKIVQFPQIFERTVLKTDLALNVYVFC